MFSVDTWDWDSSIIWALLVITPPVGGGGKDSQDIQNLAKSGHPTPPEIWKFQYIWSANMGNIMSFSVFFNTFLLSILNIHI